MKKCFSFCLIALLAALFLPFLQSCQQASVHSRPDINHLKGEKSPYLLEHANDPVHWYPWCDEAFARARQENKPLFLSIGFASCHWCHVMHSQSFMDPATAKILNDNFISIKVDREERPYIDEVYCRAAQAISGRGGWPLSVFLLPDKEPFFAGTYFPKTDADGLPAFTKVLQSVLDGYHQRKGKIEKTANDLCRAIYDFDGKKEGPAPDKTTVPAAGATLFSEVDRQYGGIMGVRKFALPGALNLAMQLVVLDPQRKSSETNGYLEYLSSTLNHMALGGVHDQLNGGFFRYSTDRQWHIPHFEKMLADNALLAQIYLQASLLTGNQHWKSIGIETLDFCLSEFATPEGTFLGSSDADSGGREGTFYTYTPEEITSVLGPADGKLFCTVYSVTAKGNTKEGRSVLYFFDSEEKLAQTQGIKLPEFESRIKAMKVRLAGSKMISERIKPIVDKKVITGWNGLMISALVEGYKVSGDEKYLAAARKCAGFLLKNLCQGKWLERVWVGDKAEVSGCLDDYAFLIRALLDLATVDSDPKWLERAIAFNDTVVAHFFSHRVGFYLTANNKEQALVRTGCARDNGVASPAAIEFANLFRLYQITGDPHLSKALDRTVKPFEDDVRSEPTSYGFLLSAIDLVFHKGDRLEIVEGSDKKVATSLKQEVYRCYAPHMVTVLLGPQQFASLAHANQQAQPANSAGAAGSAAYFCNLQTKTCEKPVADPAALRAKLVDLAAHGAL
jgi:uncharacterized protein